MAQAWHLVSRPQGLPTRANFALRPVAAAPLADGEVRVRNRWLSVDPYMRGRMNEGKSYIPPFALDRPMEGGAVGEVIESRDPGFAPGDRVLHMLGWRDEATGPGKAFTRLPQGPDDRLFLGLLGLTGATAHIGLLTVAAAKPGDVVFVSAAAGAVGSAAVQIAKIKGMTVIGSAGGADKCAMVCDLGADAAIDYKAPGRLIDKLAAAAPDGIDVYFDNVGGDHLDAALAAARQGARFAICGMIGNYNQAEPETLRHLRKIIVARIRIEGFIYADHHDRMPAFMADMQSWITAGQITQSETVRDGLVAMPQAFLDLFSGGNTGKMLVRI